jgi:hypothetical protein
MCQIGRTAVVERITSQATLTRQAEQRLAENLGKRVGSALLVLMTPNQARKESSPAEAGSLLVEAEPVGYCGRFPATGNPKLGQDP